MNRFAIVVSSDIGYLQWGTALLNGLCLYGTQADIHLLKYGNIPEKYLNKNPGTLYLHEYSEMPEVDTTTSNKYTPLWWTNYGRYITASQLLDRYDAVMIIDADSFVSGDLTPELTLCAESGEMVMVHNIFGLACNNEIHIDNFSAATTPPCHCHGAIFNKKHKDLLRHIFDWGVREDYCDMSAMWRTILRDGFDVTKIIQLDNDLWCMTHFYRERVIKTITPMGIPKLHMEDKGTEVKVVHGRYHPTLGYRADEINNCAAIPGHIGTHNVNLFIEMYNWLAAQGPFKLEDLIS